MNKKKKKEKKKKMKKKKMEKQSRRRRRRKLKKQKKTRSRGIFLKKKNKIFINHDPDQNIAICRLHVKYIPAIHGAGYQYQPN